MKGHHVDPRFPLTLIFNSSRDPGASLFLEPSFPVVFVLIQSWSSSIFFTLRIIAHGFKYCTFKMPIKWLLFHWHFSKFNIICHPFLFQLQPTFRSLIGFLYIHNHKVPLIPCIFFSNSLDQLAKTSFKKSLKGLSEI